MVNRFNILNLEEDILSNPNRKTEMVKIMIQTLENLGYEYLPPQFFQLSCWYLL